MKPTLIVLAAGMGSRYGGMKQVDPVGPGGEAILDYSLYDAYSMTKEARIKKLGDTLGRVEDALDAVDLKEVPPEKLLDYQLKYREALQKEYVGTEPAFRAVDRIEARDIVTALGDLLNRLRAGDVTPEQATRESLVLSNLLKAYETVEVKAELERIKAVIESR